MKRILYKISGEALMNNSDMGEIVKDIIYASNRGLEIAIVIGGGNIFRGANAKEHKMNRIYADHIGMLATQINAIFLSNAINQDYISIIMAPSKYGTIIQDFNINNAIQTLQQKHILILSGGTGMPMVSTDTNATLRAIEMKCDLLIKGTKHNGIYDSDPAKNQKSKRYDYIHYDEALQKQLAFMDYGSIQMAKEEGIPVCVAALSNSLLSNLIHNQCEYSLMSEYPMKLNFATI